MKSLRVAAAALNQTALDWDGNLENIRNSLRLAQKQGADILCLPELCISGYGCEDQFHSRGLADCAWEVLHELLSETKHMIVCLGLPLWHENVLFNCAGLAVDGKIAGFVAKRHLAGDGVHYEPRWFKPWPAGLKAQYNRDGYSYPLGDIDFQINGIKIGFEICEDAWVSNRKSSQTSAAGWDVILNPSASHFAFGKHEIRKHLVLEGSRAAGAVYLYSNLLGCESGRQIYDGDCMIAAGGELKTQAARFSYHRQELIFADIDLERQRLKNARQVSFEPQLSIQSNRVEIDRIEFSAPKMALVNLPIASWEQSAFLKMEEFWRACGLGLWDYMRKSRSRGFVVSLSGGADSSAISCLISLMLKSACAQLSQSELKQALSHFDSVEEIRGDDSQQKSSRLIKRILCCVYQSTKNSGEQTENAAQQLAQTLGAEYFKFEVQPVVDQYLSIVSSAVGRSITWGQDDLALQNIQARVRSPGIWLLANLKGALLLTTSNRSEAAVGYCTMDGDTSGGLCPLGGVDKAFLRSWLVWLEKTGSAEAEPIPVLALVNSQQPTAELRPAEAKQTDEADLMPYVVLDRIERLAIRDKKTPLQVYQILLAELCSTYEASLLKNWVKKFFQLWARNQWKRERLAPSFHLDDENLDPKTWCRFPIISAGFERELRQLEALGS